MPNRVSQETIVHEIEILGEKMKSVDATIDGYKEVTKHKENCQKVADQAQQCIEPVHAAVQKVLQPTNVIQNTKSQRGPSGP